MKNKNTIYVNNCKHTWNFMGVYKELLSGKYEEEKASPNGGQGYDGNCNNAGGASGYDGGRKNMEGGYSGCSSVGAMIVTVDIKRYKKYQCDKCLDIRFDLINK